MFDILCIYLVNLMNVNNLDFKAVMVALWILNLPSRYVYGIYLYM